MPSHDGIAIFHATDVQFSPKGRNVLCTSPTVDLKSAYNADFGKTSNLTTFMQVTVI